MFTVMPAVRQTSHTIAVQHVVIVSERAPLDRSEWMALGAAIHVMSYSYKSVSVNGSRKVSFGCPVEYVLTACNSDSMQRVVIPRDSLLAIHFNVLSMP